MITEHGRHNWSVSNGFRQGIKISFGKIILIVFGDVNVVLRILEPFSYNFSFSVGSNLKKDDSSMLLEIASST